jgi:dephospho-CoA kinase
MTLRVGITGGMGSGKSTVGAIFGVLGIPVYRADDAAKLLMGTDSEVIAAVTGLFGENAYINGSLNRRLLSETVFGDPAKLAALNAIIHPVTIRDAQHWMEQQQGPYAVKEAAILFESGAQQLLDFVIGVYAPPVLRVQRSMQRDGLTREAVLQRMDRQLDESLKMKLCDAVIVNDELQALLPQVLRLHQQLTEMAGHAVHPPRL